MLAPTLHVIGMLVETSLVSCCQTGNTLTAHGSLKTSLNLPPIEPRPPIQPRLYKRLYNHLNTILQLAPGARLSTTSRVEHGNSVRTPNPANISSTPRRVASTAPVAPAAAATPSKTAATPVSRRLQATSSQFPPWVRPTVRYICHELGHPQLAPTIVAGLSAIHTEVAIEAKEKRNRPRNRDEKGDTSHDEAVENEEEEEDLQEWLDDSLTALVAALYLYCMSSWRENVVDNGCTTYGTGNSGLQERQFQLDEKAILGAFEKVRGVVGARDDTDWDGWQDLHKRTFRDALVVVSKQQWLQSDWYGDIVTLQPSTLGDENNGQPTSDDGIEGNDDGDGDYGGVSIPTKAWPADSMFQSRWDFLSPSKQQDYDLWRAQMLDRIKRAEAVQQLPVAMDVE